MNTVVRQRLTREENRVQTRERLLSSASEVFARSGYEGATVDAIAENAGYSKGAFYSNFDSKESVFLELLELHKQREVQVLREMLEEEAPAETLLEQIQKFYQELESDVDWGLLSAEFQIQAGRDQVFAKRYAKLFLDHRNVLANLIEVFSSKPGRSCPVSSQDVANILMAMSSGLSLQRCSVSGSLPKGFLGRAISFILSSVQQKDGVR